MGGLFLNFNAHSYAFLLYIQFGRSYFCTLFRCLSQIAIISPFSAISHQRIGKLSPLCFDTATRVLRQLLTPDLVQIGARCSLHNYDEVSRNS